MDLPSYEWYVRRTPVFLTSSFWPTPTTRTPTESFTIPLFLSASSFRKKTVSYNTRMSFHPSITTLFPFLYMSVTWIPTLTIKDTVLVFPWIPFRILGIRTYVQKNTMLRISISPSTIFIMTILAPFACPICTSSFRPNMSIFKSALSFDPIIILLTTCIDVPIKCPSRISPST